jgi:ERCC4-type nuclease
MTLPILCDTREQKPWKFEPFDVALDTVTLSTGDYTVPSLCDYDEELDTYNPVYAVERKEGGDFMSSITRDMDRFQDELARASEWSSPLLVVIEEPKEPSRYSGKHFMKYYDVDRSQVFNTVETLERHYNVSFNFAGSRDHAQRLVYDTLNRMSSFTM